VAGRRELPNRTGLHIPQVPVGTRGKTVYTSFSGGDSSDGAVGTNFRQRSAKDRLFEAAFEPHVSIWTGRDVCWALGPPEVDGTP